MNTDRRKTFIPQQLLRKYDCEFHKETNDKRQALKKQLNWGK